MSQVAGPPVDLTTPTGAIDLLLDTQWLGDLVGAPVTTRRIRHKPGVSTVAAYGPGTGPATGWVQLVAPGAGDKVANAERRATDRGHGVDVRSLAQGWTVVHGGVVTDPRLHRALDQLPAAVLDQLAAGEGMPVLDQLPAAQGVGVLRYNPHRRLVLRWADTVLRLTETRQADVVGAARALAAAGVPTAQPTKVPGGVGGRRVSAWPWIEGPDLLAHPEPGAAREAGAVLARWHALPVPDPAVHPQQAVPGVQMQDVLDELHTVSPHLADTAGPVIGALADRLRVEQTGDTVWSHGDFSADQLVVAPGGGVRVIDLDRTCRAPAGLDLGSFCAVELSRHHEDAPAADLSKSLLEGYAVAGGVVPAPDALRSWTAYALVTRLTAPMRHARPDWRAGLEHRWVQVQEVLSG